MRTGRQPKLNNEDLYCCVQGIFDREEWTSITMADIAKHVEKSLGISYTPKGLSNKMLALVEDGKLEYKTEWTSGKWKLPAEGGNTDGTSSGPESKENLIG